jgi:hypothetical protein
MAFIIKSEGAPGSALSYQELASLWRSASKGNAVARIALAKLPPGEQRLAEMVFKSYDGTKPKKSKKLTKAQKRDIMRTPALTPEQRAAAMFLDSANPSDREAARELLGKM